MSSRPMSYVKGEDDLDPVAGHPQEDSVLSQGDAGSSRPTNMGRSMSTSSTKIADASNPSRGGTTLKKRGSLKKRTSLRRTNSRRSVTAGSIKGTGEEDDEYNSVYHTPVPTSGSPTDILANRFQVWRNLLKDLITYFREIQNSYEQRSKTLLKINNVVNNIHPPSSFRSTGGIDDALHILRDFHKQSTTEASKSREIENDVIVQLNGLRNDLSQKIKEIKSLSGDFKNTVDREKDGTRKAVSALQDSLSMSEKDPASASGKNDPFIIRLAVHRQIEKQIEEENYLHRAYLNLEGSGRELEQIVIGEIQKAYNAYAGILKREVDACSNAAESLRAGPIAMPKDHEWAHFAENDPHFVNPNLPLRKVDGIVYPGKFNPAASEIRGGMLERKSKYLKSYTPGWYVLSATHLHEFKSADHLSAQSPVMSLPLHDQRLGSHSQPSTTSHKFSLKGKQSGTMHRGHSWVFRAESYDTMMAWYEDIRNLTEKTGVERAAFVRKHARSLSGGSHPGAAPSVSSDGVEDDEADEVPYSASAANLHASHAADQTGTTGERVEGLEVGEAPQRRPSPGGRFPSDINVNRDSQGLQRASSESSGSRGLEHPTAVPAAAATVAHNGSSDFERGQTGQRDLEDDISAEDALAVRQAKRPQGSKVAALLGGEAPSHTHQRQTIDADPEQVQAASALSAAEPRHHADGGHIVSAGAPGATSNEPMYTDNSAAHASNATAQELPTPRDEANFDGATPGADNPISPPPQLQSDDDLFAAGALGGLSNTGSPPQSKGGLAGDRESAMTGLTSPPDSAGLGGQIHHMKTSEIHVPGEFPERGGA